MTTFRALRVHSAPGQYSAGIETISLDDLSPGQVVIKVLYSSLNYKDALAVTGKGRIVRGSPRVPGIDLAGTVVASEMADVKPGDTVLVTGCGIGEHLDGGLAEYARVESRAVVPMPPGFSPLDAMALGTAGFTAALTTYRLLDNHQSPDMGPIAITGPTGGVGSIAGMLLKKLGFTVHAITSRADATGDYLKSLGFDEVIDRHSLDVSVPVKERPLLTAQWGGAVDNIGGPTLSWLLRSTRQFGNVASIGLAASPDFDTTVMPFILRGVSLIGISSVETLRPRRLELWRRLSHEWKLDDVQAKVAPRIVSLDEVPAVCAEMIAGRNLGRTIVRIGA